MFTATQASNNSFTFNADYQTQANAEKSCQRQGAHLAVYMNEDEQLEVCCWLLVCGHGCCVCLRQPVCAHDATCLAPAAGGNALHQQRMAAARLLPELVDRPQQKLLRQLGLDRRPGRG